MVVSQKHIAIIDPHKKCIKPKSDTSPAGTKKKLSKLFKHTGHVSTFESIFNLSTTNFETYNGTIFRFPLRRPNSDSEISTTTYTPEKIQTTLFESLKEESPYILLFLRYVKSISLMEWKTGSPHPEETFRVDALDQEVSEDITGIAPPSIELVARQISQSSEDGELEVCVKLKSMTVTINNYSSEADLPHHWLVLKVVGTNDSNLNKLGKELSTFPWVGLATSLPQRITLHECSARTAARFDDHNTVEATFKQLEGSLKKSQISTNWPREPVNNAAGHAYCFLPLPESTAMPVHVHGYFAVTDNRRSIKWPMHDEKGKEAQWNEGLLYKMVAPAYSLLLSCRAGLIRYEGTPLPITNTEDIADAYSTWPLYPEVKNVPIWNELVLPTMDCSSSLPLLWTSACGGKWIQFSKAHFLPGSFTECAYNCSRVVIQMLVKLDTLVVGLPTSICETIKQSEKLMELVKGKEISPQFVREMISRNSHYCSSLSKEEVYEMLEFVLSDLNQSNYHLLSEIPLLPLKGVSGVVVFQRPASSYTKYIFPSDSRSLLDIVPGADSLIVDPELPEMIAKKLCEIASTGCLQLKVVDTEAMCKLLLPKSVYSWCSMMTGAGWKWLPGHDPYPCQSWMDALWRWIAETKVSLSALEGLPIIPQFIDHQSYEVTLLKVSKGAKMCRLSATFSLRERGILTSILKKLGVLIVDGSKMNDCNKMKQHPDFESYVPELSQNSELIVTRYLDKLDVTRLLQTVQQLDNTEKDFLRKQFYNLYESCVQYQGCLQSIPIYLSACSSVLSPTFISLSGVGSDNLKAFLPPDNIPSLPDHPSNMLCSATSPEEKLFLQALAVRQLSLSDLCTNNLIPLALRHIQSHPNSWSIGDELVLWILKQQLQSLETVLHQLSQYKVVYTRHGTHKLPQDIYDPQDQTLTILFDFESDKDKFPDERYMQESHYRQALRKMGMNTWEDFKNNRTLMYTMLHDRMNSVCTLTPSAQLSRGQFIVQILAEPNNNYSLQQYAILNGIRFLKAEACSSSYPSFLQGMWYGQNDRLYSISELSSPDGQAHNLVGTSMPILSSNYYRGRYAVPMSAFERLAFQKHSIANVKKHLENMHSSAVALSDDKDIDKFDKIVMCVYEYLHTNTSGLKLPFIWWRVAELPNFLLAKKFILDLPEGYQMNLEPFYYSLKLPMRKYANLFQLHDPLTPATMAEVVRAISKHGGGILSDHNVKVCVSILNWLCEKDYKETGMLMITEENKLIPAMDCVYDDRDWMKHSKSQGHIKGKRLQFVNDQIPQKVAKHFNVEPLSCKVAPSQKLDISYTRTGQYEDITQRIRRIVQDYETDIDIFKELIQNADDAEASEVKFLIDWREHSKDSLLSEELKEWQGPALVVYNNATFSDEDFSNICKVAGETKKRNPLKTGRFGVGFCALYHLTDLPSFISRRFFTIFDPHTSYLKDRINTQQPGMRIDLVKHQADLQLLQCQFKPYESIFGCDVFNLSGDGYQGTIFRFPFRSESTSTKSKICSTIYNRKLVSSLVHSLKEQGEKLLLFSKYVSKVSVYKLEKGNDPSAPSKLFSVKRTLSGSTMERLKLITNYGCSMYPGEASCSDKFRVKVKDGDKPSLETHWMVSSAIKSPSGTSTNLQRHPEAVGLLPLAEVAIRLDPSKKDPTFNIPTTSYDMGKVFCFLPLPIESKLPFHVNGFFSIGKDRRNISATNDGTFGSLWNKSLAEGALVAAFITLLQSLTNKSNLQHLSNPDVKQEYLHCYYLLWKVKDAAGLIGDSFAAAFKKCVPTIMHSILWSEKNGGCWLSPVSVVVFKDSRLKQKDTKQVIEKDAITLLLKNGYGVVDLPSNVYEILKSSLTKNKREYNYEKFCTEVFFPRISMIDQSVRDRHVLFLLERIGEYFGTTVWYDWAESFLRNSPCIRCQYTNTLRPASQLISPSNELFKKLYDVTEGRFPNEDFQKSSIAMQGLTKLGMASDKLIFSDFKERAESVTRLQNELALKRSLHFCEYVDSAYGPKYYYGSLNLNKPDEGELQQIFNIPFLTVKQKPQDVDVPWCGMARRFECPSRVYSSNHEHLVFSQYPVVEINSKKLLDLLGISSNQPTPEMVIAHLRCVIRHVKSNPNDSTIQFLNSSMKEVYRYLQNHYLFFPQLVSNLKQLQKFIWQEGCFLGSNQVLRHWQQKCIPYMCELSSENKDFMSLWSVVGVKQEATLEVLVDILQRIASDHSTHTPISDEILKFVAFVAGELYLKLHIVCVNIKDYSSKIYLPDKNRIMRTVSQLADNVSKDWLKSSSAYQKFLSSGSGYFVHESIPRDHAIKLGVKPLLDAVVEEFEDSKFLEGTDFGQEEELCDRLNGILEKYPPNTSIFKEFIQNADDAQATEIIFVLDHRIKFSDNKLLSSQPNWKSLQKTPALCIFNNRKFTETDIEGITKLGRGSKSHSAELIGKFGIGFNVAYHVTDCPSFVSYSEIGTPEYLCVFDPTRTYVPQATKHSPGRKWNFKGKEDHYSEFSEQFEPYLTEDLNRLAEQTPHCLQDYKSHGYVVFRLPLTRYGHVSSGKLKSGHRFHPTDISKLFKEFATDSQDLLLFLNHLRNVSAFEIKENGSFIHHFTTTASVPSQDLKKHETFSRHVKQFSHSLCTKGAVEPLSLTHRMDVTCIQPESNIKESQSQWLVQRAISGTGLPRELLQAGLNQGLRPIGGVATLIKPQSDYQYRLFCFLPLPFQSNLPAHVNGHFWVDDSRKHLESSMHHGLENWNISIAQKVIVPAYVDLIMEAKRLLDTTDNSGWFYSLFPRMDEPDAESETNKIANVGELTNLNIVHFFYSELLQRNPSVLIREMPQPSSNATWMAVRSCLFSVPFVSEKTCNQLSVSEELRSALVALGMPVTTAPNYIYGGCSVVDSNFKISAIIDPDKIVDHLQRLRCTEEHKQIIKKHIQSILYYCMCGYPPHIFQSLFENALYLIAKDGSLQHGCLFGSCFSELLPHCSNKFIDPELEKSNVGMKLQEISYCVIRALPLEFVSSNIQLSTTNAACSLNQFSARILNLLWTYIAQHPLTVSSVPEKLKNLFHSKPIIPTDDGQVYPVSMSKMLVRDTAGQCDQCTIMKRLGYPQIDFKKIELSDETSKQLSGIINNLTSCFTEGQDIIDCFLLQPPSNFDIELSNDEAQCFQNSLGKLASPQSLGQISTYLLKLPLFQTIDGSRITLHGVGRVFILQESSLESGVPFDGVSTSSNAQVVLKTANSKSMKLFYDMIIPADKKVYVGSEEFYIQIVLPILPTLEDSFIKKHVEYLHLHKDSMTRAFNCLKETPFISHNGNKYKINELCDHRIQFFATFKQEHILPVQWRKVMVVMESLDLQKSVTTTEWLRYARKFSIELGSKVEHKSRVLFDQLIEIINDGVRSNGDLISFLKDASDIRFIYSAEKWELNRILSYMFPIGRQRTALANNMVKFRESVSFHEADNACLCRSVLPEHCQGIINNSSIRQALFIESPITPTTVAENLLCLCECMSASCARSQNINQANVTKLIQILEGHYAFLNVSTPPPEIITKLRDGMCILPKQSQLLQLVKPSQLVMHLQPDCFLEPYCYKVERWLQKYGVFLTSIGVRQELTAQDYIEILLHVKEGIEDNSSDQDADSEDVGIDEKESKVIESAYKELIRRLREEDTISNGTVLYLPDEELNLTKVSDLCLDDVPWYRSRLPPDCGFKFILQPPADSERNRTLPEVLKVQRLSDIITEALTDSCKAPDFMCTYEELFATNKRTKDGRCVFVKNILETLKSDKLYEGFCRMYFTQYKRPPPEPFKRSVKKLEQVQVYCVKADLKSVLYFRGKPISGTEDTSKLCHLCRRSDGVFSLYISPHKKSVEEGELSPFFKDLAVCIGKLIDNVIENMVPIAAVFECCPSEIPMALTREQVHEYSEEDVKPTKPSIIGTQVPWSRFPPQESLIVLNFEPKDRVRYLDDKGVLINAEIIQADNEGMLNMMVTVKVKEVDIKQGDDEIIELDDEDLEAVDGRSTDDMSLVVSPMQVFKVLDNHQRRSLWSESASPFACPIVLETVPSEDSTKFKEWLDKIYASSVFTSHSGLIQSVFTLRLLGHVHYQLVTQKKNHTLFNEAALMLQDKFHGFPQTSEHMHIGILLESIIESETTELVLGSSIKSIFPSKELGQIIEHSETNIPEVLMISDQGPPPSVVQQPAPSQVGGVSAGNQPQVTPASNRYTTTQSARTRRGHRNPRYPLQAPPAPPAAGAAVAPQQVPPPPNICLPSATAWLEQAKADYNAAKSLLCDAVTTLSATSVDSDTECKFPALVCFLCHDTVEKSIKGVLYAFCGLRQDLVNNSSLVMLKEALASSPHHPGHLLDPINECVNTINKHENMSRLPNYRHYPPCAPASTYYTSDAKEAFSATTKLLHHLQSEATLNVVLRDLGQLPAKRFMSSLQSLPDDQGTKYMNNI